LAAAPAGNGGILRINSLPWAQVFVDGQMVGYTPQRSIRVSPGEHDVRLVNPMFAMRKALHVKVGQGQQVTQSVILEE
jgi:serine/threonine-protein kinase